MIHRLKTVGLFLGVLGFFVLTLPANHTEAEDCYTYARLAEQAPWAEMFHAHHLLYLPCVRLLFRIVQVFDETARALPVLIAISMFCGAGAVCLFVSVLRRMKTGDAHTWTFTGCLLFSYGFWRYSTTAEIYIPAALCSLIVFDGVLRASNQERFSISAAMLGGLALLLHLATIPAVLFAAPLVYGMNRQKAFAGYQVGIALLVAAVGYGVVMLSGVSLAVFSDEQVVRGSVLLPTTWLKATAAFGQVLLSGNFLFALPSVAESLVRLFPYHMLQEELYAGQHAAGWIRGVAPVTFGFGCGLLAGGIGWIGLSVRKTTNWPFVTVVPPAIWLLSSIGLAVWFEPANPEMWILVLPSFWLFAAQLWSLLPARGSVRWGPIVLIVTLALHNWAGGLMLIDSPSSDYCRQKAAWMMEEAQANDLIVTADSQSFVSYLQYNTSARILDAKFASLDEFNQLAGDISGHVFIFEDVIDPLAPVLRRAPAAVQKMEAFVLEIGPGLKTVHRDEFGAIYRWGTE